jgi:cysteine desulfurase
VLNSCKRLEALGVETTFLPVDGQGLVSPADVRSALRPNTRLISVMMANNETGALQPVEEIGRIAAEADVWFHTDAVQAAGKVPIDVGRIGCDLLTISAHKLHGPQGVGALYVRRGTLLQPMMHGGRHERGRRAGTENLPGIAGLGKAAEVAREWLAGGGAEKMAAMRNRFESHILRQVESTRANSGQVARTPNTSNIVFECIEGEALVIALDLKGVAVSGGSACHSGATEPSHVLMAMGVDKARARASLRFSLLKTATEADVDYVLKVVPEAVEHLRAISPVATGTLG